MPQLPSIRRHLLVIVLFVALCGSHTAHAAEPTMVDVPVLWAAKSWLIGYSLLFLGILLGLLAVLIPSMRKVLRKKE